mmetsp:Transcript_3043/g.10694  ORF Transcript_3043/g.10694 Transcript_3043/m.10694 type:complete len:367 (+) Transcript_3043:73-1173(+)
MKKAPTGLFSKLSLGSKKDGAGPGGEKEKRLNEKYESLDQFHVQETLGTGTFGRVRLCQHKKEGQYFALKILKKNEIIRLKQVEHILSEKMILAQVDHPFVVNLFATYKDEKNLYMLMEYVPGGEIFSHLRRAGRFTNDTTRFFSGSIVLAIQYLHGKDIVYRDLKPENILLDKDGHIKITDFGLAKANVADNSSAHTFCGTPEYLAPEILSGKGHGRAVDWWSLGTLMFEMLSGLPPYYDQNVNTMYRKILQDPLTFPPFFSAKAKDILGKLLNRSPEQRLGSGPTDAEELKTHPFFDAMDWQALLDRRVVPEFKPKVQGDLDANNFDPCFTAEPAQDTPKEGSALTGAQEFDGFTFVADSALKR